MVVTVQQPHLNWSWSITIIHSVLTYNVYFSLRSLICIVFNKYKQTDLIPLRPNNESQFLLLSLLKKKNEFLLSVWFDSATWGIRLRYYKTLNSHDFICIYIIIQFALGSVPILFWVLHSLVLYNNLDVVKIVECES